MGLLKSGFMQPVEDTTPIEESETLISDIPDDAFGHVLFWLPPLTNLAAARVAKQWRVHPPIAPIRMLLQPRPAGTRRPVRF